MDESRRESLRAYLESVATDDVSRRNFLRLLGASIALAGIDGCTRLPSERILPYVDQPELTPGIPLHYATAMVLDGYATGVIVESSDGRPTKIEGNPDHPASLGAAGVFEQASVLQLYDPHRSKRIRRGRSPSTWSEFAREFAPASLRQGVGSGGERLHLLMEPTSSPLEAELLRHLAELYPGAGIHFYAPFAPQAGAEPFRVGTRALVPQYDVRAADVIVAIDADFLAGGPFHLRYARAFAERRRPETAPGGMNRLYVIEPSVSVTGAAADHRLTLLPSEIEPLLEQLLTAVSSASTQLPSAQSDSVAARFTAAAARDLASHRGRSLVVGGPRLRARAHALVHALNQRLENVEHTVWFTESPLIGAGDARHALTPLSDALRAGLVDTLICIGGNPSYATARAPELSQQLRRVARSVYVGLYENETARDCGWMVPAAHYLESWGDARAYDGTLSVVQPLIEPMYGGKTASEVLAALLGDGAARAHDLLRADWARRGETDGSWRSALGRGVVSNTSSARVAASFAFSQPVASPSQHTGLEIVFAVDGRVHDGRFGNNAWLQELPDPITTLTWGNAAHLSGATAARLGVANGDVVRLRTASSSIEIPALVVPGHADNVMSLHVGYGRAGAELIAAGVGANVLPLWPGNVDAPVVAELQRTGKQVPLALTQAHWSLEPNTPARSMSLAEVQRAPPRKPSRALSLYQPPSALPDGPARNQWAMTIDLSACIGCGACAVACQAENNVPVVGVDDVRKGREMHWLRIDRYVAGAADATGTPEFISQPMLCQQCEKAPCEYVCPVEATVHSPDGLNEMVYNRCVGTRFCSNNCPYKVRRFNWLDYNAALAPSEIMGKNPDVTVRERGVMEKCTFCVQRIREAEITASTDGRALRTDEVRTACQQACPTNAIVFGSLTDARSAVLQNRDGARAYAALEELGTEPRVRYLARVRNPNPELGSRP